MTHTARWRARVVTVRIVAIGLTSVLAGSTVVAQPSNPGATRIIIGSLANDTKPGDLDFQGGECLVSASGRQMDCEFQQVFMTRSPLESDTCLVTTNRFERRFEKQNDTTWTSRADPTGPCGIVDIATLVDEGREIRWSLEFRTEITNRADAACRGDNPPAERFSWKAVRRPLPCRFVQPGAVR